MTDDSRIGAVVGGRYRLTEQIAVGGMGVVYRAERLQLGRTVAIKFLHPSFAGRGDILRRFENEARAMGRLAHPHCVSVIDFGVEEGAPYLVMDYVSGQTLRELIDGGPLSPARALSILRQILAGLAHAHGQNIIHRDIKPANIILTEATGTGDHVRILDFGLAKLRDGSGGDTSVTALAIGTPSYMSPEQARGDAIDARSDIYSVGVLTYELLTGEKPFFSDQAFEIIAMHAKSPPPRLRTKMPGLSEALEATIVKAMAKRPEDRYQTAAEMADALAQVPEAGTRAPSAVLPPDPSIPIEVPRRWPRFVIAALSLGAVGVGFYWVVRRQEDQRAAAAVTRPPNVVLPDARVEATVAPIAPPPRQPDARPVAVVAVAAIDAELPPPPPPDAPPPPPPDAAPPDAPAAVDDEPEDKPAVEVEAPFEVKSFSDVQELVAAGRRDEAISGLERLRRGSPKNAFYAYYLGNLYFQRKWWTDGLESYEAAIGQSRAYRTRPQIIKNAIVALSSAKTVAKAQKLLVRDIGAPAIPYLKAAAKGDPSNTVRARATALLRLYGKR
jgi:serine/threonine-protein kinase